MPAGALVHLLALPRRVPWPYVSGRPSKAAGLFASPPLAPQRLPLPAAAAYDRAAPTAAVPALLRRACAFT